MRVSGLWVGVMGSRLKRGINSLLPSEASSEESRGARPLNNFSWRWILAVCLIKERPWELRRLGGQSAGCQKQPSSRAFHHMQAVGLHDGRKGTPDLRFRAKC